MRVSLLLISAILLLTGCFNDLSDLHEFTESVKNSTVPRVAPLPEITPFNHVAYKSGTVRSPFAVPVPEEIQEKLSLIQDCLHPDPLRRKEPLEKYALDNLRMRGTLGDTGQLWALVEALDKTLHRVTVNNYLGLFHGRIISVSTTQIELLELIPDGSGCWEERTTMLKMTESSATGSN